MCVASQRGQGAGQQTHEVTRRDDCESRVCCLFPHLDYAESSIQKRYHEQIVYKSRDQNNTLARTPSSSLSPTSPSTVSCSQFLRAVAATLQGWHTMIIAGTPLLTPCSRSILGSLRRECKEVRACTFVLNELSVSNSRKRRGISRYGWLTVCGESVWI